MPVPWMDLDEQCLEIMCLPFLQDKYELKSCWSTKCWWKHHQSDQVVVDEMIKAWLCLSLSPQTNHRYTRVTQVFTSFVYFLKIFASRSFFEMISIQYLWKVPLQFWVYFDCNDTFRSPEEFKAIGWDYLDLYHYHRMRQKQRRGVLWIKALIWHKLQLSVYKWSSGTGTNIVDISHNRQPAPGWRRDLPGTLASHRHQAYICVGWRRSEPPPTPSGGSRAGPLPRPADD